VFTGMGAGTAKYTRGLPVSYPNHCIDLGAKRRSGPVPWNDIYMWQTEFVNQLEYMPILSSCASSSAPAKSRSSTVAPGEIAENEEAMSSDFVLLQEPSKMQKNHITACFTHWMAWQEEGKIGFEFTNVFDSQEGALQLVV
jgi:hypothetical protein